MHKTRIRRLKSRLARRQLDYALIVDPSSIFYFCGYQGDEAWLLVTRDESVLLTNFIYMNEATAQTRCARVVITSRGGYAATLAEQLGRRRIRRLGVVKSVFTLGTAEALEKALGRVAYTDIGPDVSELRAIKDDAELVALRKAVRVAEASFKAICGAIRPGTTENVLYERLRGEMVRRGSRAKRFWAIVAGGRNAALCHYETGRVRLRDDSAVLFDFGANVDCYSSDITRTLRIGDAPRAMRRIYAVVDEARRRAIAAVRPGRDAAELDAIARKVIDDAGFGECFGHSLGHGIGIDLHEWPAIAARGRGVRIRKGMVFTIEPGIYIPGKYGVRIEDMVRVTSDGAEVLTGLPRNF